MPTLMAVHAHPDDEVMSTGGILARYSDAGVTTVVVTCTNGELGDLPGGIKPDDERHEIDLVVKMRRDELDRACAILGVTHLVMLGYRDSGMADWEHKGHADAFCNVPLEEAAGRLIELFETYRPDVVVTYNQDSAYNHPDHIQASRVALAAIERTGIPKKVYLTAMRANRFQRIREILTEQGVELPQRPPPSEDWIRKTQEQEARITTVVDVGHYAAKKLAALREHASQISDSFWGRLPEEALGEVFGEESFIRIADSTGSELPEDDLLAGIR
jgi:LmbE family N-acetylglucosaminyl deacetylase